MYCSVQCEKDDWNTHKFICNLGRPIDSVDILIRDYFENTLPEDESVQKDFGFMEYYGIQSQSQSRSHLLDLYIGLIVNLRTSEDELRRHRDSNEMKQLIIEKYSTLPPDSRGMYHAWSLQQDKLHKIFASCGKEPSMSIQEWLQESIKEEGTAKALKSDISHLRVYQDALIFYGMITKTSHHPGPSSSTWVDLGLCTARDAHEERIIGALYRLLFQDCGFDAFWQARQTSNLPALIHCYKIAEACGRHHNFLNLLAESGVRTASVWHLKCFIKSHQREPSRLVVTDYGFANCANHKQRTRLRTIYSTRMSWVVQYRLRERSGRSHLTRTS